MKKVMLFALMFVAAVGLYAQQGSTTSVPANVPRTVKTLKVDQTANPQTKVQPAPVTESARRDTAVLVPVKTTGKSKKQ